MGGACIDPIFGPTAPHEYWSATKVLVGPSPVWFLDFSGLFVGGFAGASNSIAPFHAREVRSAF
jgi:hypothetical protein